MNAERLANISIELGMVYLNPERNTDDAVVEVLEELTRRLLALEEANKTTEKVDYKSG